VPQKKQQEEGPRSMSLPLPLRPVSPSTSPPSPLPLWTVEAAIRHSSNSSSSTRAGHPLPLSPPSFHHLTVMPACMELPHTPLAAAVAVGGDSVSLSGVWWCWRLLRPWRLS